MDVFLAILPIENDRPQYDRLRDGAINHLNYRSFPAWRCLAYFQRYALKYDKWGLGYSGTGYKGQGKTQVKTAAVYDNPYAWDMRAAYVIGTRHKEDYQLFVPRELAPDLTALTGQVMRQREDKGSSLRFEAAETYDMRHRLGAELFSQKLRATLEKGREVLTAAAQAERERLRQAEELRKAQELKHMLKPGRGPRLGM